MFTRAVFISAERSNMTPAENTLRTYLLEELLFAFNLNYKLVEGSYKGVEETSFMVELNKDNNKGLGTIKALAKGFGQESIMIKNEAERCELHYMTDGRIEEIGLLSKRNPKELEQLDSYSIIDNALYAVI